MKPYSKDLRLKVLAAVNRGMPRAQVANVFSVSVPTIKRWLKRRRETGDVAPQPIPGPPARKWEALKDALPSQIRSDPDFTLEEHRELFEESYGIPVSTATLSRAFKKLGLPFKKSRSSPRRGTKQSGRVGASG